MRKSVVVTTRIYSKNEVFGTNPTRSAFAKQERDSAPPNSPLNWRFWLCVLNYSGGSAIF